MFNMRRLPACEQGPSQGDPSLKFVWVTRQTPLIPTLGAYAYSNGLLRALLATGAKGRLVSYERPGGPSGQADGLRLDLSPPPTVNRAFSLISHLPSDAFRLRTAAFAQRLEAALTPDIDAVLIDFYAMGWVLPVVERIKAARRDRPLAVVYVSHQFEQLLRAEIARDHRASPIMGAALRIDSIKAARRERRLIAGADLITAITPADEIRFRRAAPGKPVITLAPGFDGAKAAPRAIDATTPRRVILAGSLDWIAKKRNFRRFLDAADAPFRAAGIELLVVGRTDPAFAADMQRRSTICRFTGEVPDIAPYMAQGRIGVMPDEVGGGFKIKLLDYVFGALPIAAIGAQVEGLPLDRDRDMILRPTAADLVGAIVEAIDDLDRLNGMQTRALAASAGRFDWSDRGRSLAEAIKGVLDG